ncbi:Serine/threonine-protein phosphatase 2A activator 1 [Cytospora mali]|uniref:Serine/threonine-protein phosphatase 2A activator n=1 Tax=Cytospora mali TaxID=578113 RepID=A0A194W0P8_CYTMA|nr:Serine/threonine-protein phosphatase 2A activator 1 [Valsa mali]
MASSQQDISASNTSSSFPQLEILNPSEPHAFSDPTKCINDGPDVARFLTSKAYRDIGIFVMQLNRALCPRKTPSGPSKTFPLVGGNRQDPESVQKLRSLLEKTETFIDEAPPDPGPRRFGNVSFRKWFQLLEGQVEGLLREFVSEEVLGFRVSGEASAQGTAEEDGDCRTRGAVDELKAYFLGSFGSPQRLDYGTGHELSFLAFLGCLWKLGSFKDGIQGGDIERSIVLGVFEPYLKVVRRLILTYTLEPAGSHGVWGLDDHSFMPYIFGSAQLTRPITEDDIMPLEGSVERAPKPGDVVKPEAVERLRETNMYFSAIGFINDVKKGPFWEHSPILYDISGIKDGWGKINKGMIKMFNAEVLSKFPVVQHFPFGSLFSWDVDPEASAPQQSVHMANQPATTTTASSQPAGSGTAAPWAQATRMPGPSGPGIPYSRATGMAPGISVGREPPRATAGPGEPGVGPTMLPPGSVRPSGPPGTAGNQISVTKAPWAK